MQTHPESIIKENIPALVFGTEDCLTSDVDRHRRRKKLELAVTLGNLEHHKAILIFSDETGIKRLVTTLWGLTDTQVQLKNGIELPINAIKQVIL